ncbi:hypothetical protein KIH23_00225 [Flavobacterium sp. CYK-55]|uniref:hypothetical protein n=1 Tax=Flavobacterium sp. CYK-55 TaxID=2835529 RepID=UPI001BCCEB87|nr:hypothetical protein [Flavobacterium sp. CYK-55]MBS7785707.1 hypothetical protein [Flavobacterium sp. CYK-55]
MLIVSKFLVPKGYRALTVFPFVFLRENGAKDDAVLLNHEQIHLAQQKELLLVGFLIWYSLDYLLNLLRYKNHKKAYKNIVFEREAYAEEKNFDYLKSRKFWFFLK